MDRSTLFDEDQKKNFVHEQDYEYSRDTYYDLIEKGRESLDLMIEVARESEHPRAFEVLSNMIKGIADVNDKLMDLNKKQKEFSERRQTCSKQLLIIIYLSGLLQNCSVWMMGDEKTIDHDDEDE